MVAAPDGAVAVSAPPTLADLAADLGELIASCLRCHRCRPAGRPGACPLRPDDTVPRSDGQVPLFGVRLQPAVTDGIDLHHA
jgi:hypothetical protein